MVTIGQCRLGRKIRRLECSVKLSSKENQAKQAGIKYRTKVKAATAENEDSPVQSLKDLACNQKNKNTSK